MPRYLFKRDVFDGNKLWEAGEPADIVDVFQPPRDAQVWDGKKFVPVPLEEGNPTADPKLQVVDMDKLKSMAGDIPEEEDRELPDLSIPRKAITSRKK
jgi:hypothetical protein